MSDCLLKVKSSYQYIKHGRLHKLAEFIARGVTLAKKVKPFAETNGSSVQAHSYQASGSRLEADGSCLEADGSRAKTVKPLSEANGFVTKSVVVARKVKPIVEANGLNLARLITLDH